MAGSVPSSDVWDEVCLTASVQLDSGLKALPTQKVIRRRRTLGRTRSLESASNEHAMLTFFATILCTVCIYLLFASFNRRGIRTAWAITLNYFVAAGLGWTWPVEQCHDDQRPIRRIWPLALIGVFLSAVQTDRIVLAGIGHQRRHHRHQIVHGHSSFGAYLGRRHFRHRLGPMARIGAGFPAVWLSARAGEPAGPRGQRALRVPCGGCRW